jgi:hypothetical protein
VCCAVPEVIGLKKNFFSFRFDLKQLKFVSVVLILVKNSQNNRVPLTSACSTCQREKV